MSIIVEYSEYMVDESVMFTACRSTHSCGCYRRINFFKLIYHMTKCVSGVKKANVMQELLLLIRTEAFQASYELFRQKDRCRSDTVIIQANDWTHCCGSVVKIYCELVMNDVIR